MRVALHNVHLWPGLAFHGYLRELLQAGRVAVLYFSDRRAVSFVRAAYRLARGRHASLQGIPWGRFDVVFSPRELNRKADVLLDLNLLCSDDLEAEVPRSLSRFDGLKVFHVGDYFWYQPGSRKHKALTSVGVQHLLGYAMHDRYCGYFHEHFPTYRGRVWGIPFGFAPRFKAAVGFEQRINRAVAVGSVNPLRPLDQSVSNFRETADYYPDENWFHRFRRMLVLNKHRLSGEVDSMLPEFPKVKDFKYDLAAKFNEYRMFVTCESIFFFPSAKVFEGPACGAMFLGADHDCNREYGFIDGVNCVLFRLYDIDDLRDKIRYYQANEEKLAEIARRGEAFVRQWFSHGEVALHVLDTIRHIWSEGGEGDATPLAARMPESSRGEG